MALFASILENSSLLHINDNITGDPEGVSAMLEISILKIQDPGCFWGRIVKGAGLTVQSPQEYEYLHVKMNLFYHDVGLDVQKIRPPSLAERQVCVVYSPTLKSWCRAVVESIFPGTDGCQVMCFLVDHADHILVSSDRIRAPLKKFLQLPFGARKFQLSAIRPMSLQVPVYREKAKLVPSAHWDSSATRYLHSLVQASSLLEVVLCEVLEDVTVIELYVTLRNVKICVNDDLVAKKFACFSSNKSASSPRSCLDDSSVTMLTCDGISNGNAFMTHDGRVSRALFSSLSPRKDPQNSGSEASQTADTGLGRGAQMPPGDAPDLEPLSPETGDAGAQACSAVGGSVGGVARRTSDHSQESIGGAFSSDGCQVDGSHHALQTETQTSLADDELLNKINLFRFLKFLNPLSISKMADPEPRSQEKTDGVKNDLEEDTVARDSASDLPEEDAAPAVQEVSAAPQHEGIPAEPLPGQVRAASDLVEEMEEEEVEAMTLREQQAPEEELGCARLLQFLNPDPLNPHVECSDTSTDSADSPHQIFQCEPTTYGVLLHSAMVIEPCTSLEHSPLTDNIRKDLVRKDFGRPRVAEWYCWPAVARGCDTVLISGRGAEPLTYIPPLLSHLHLVSACSTLTSRTGPIAVILCHGWEKAQCVFDVLEATPAAATLHPMIVLVGQKDEAKGVKIQRNCQVLVTTPFSLARLLPFHGFLFLRLCHLVLDEVDVLFSKAPEEMAVALQHFQKAVASEGTAFRSRQIVAVGQRWSREVEGLVREHMSEPCIIITVMEEAALYGDVHQMVLLCLDSTKVSVLLGTLDFIPDAAQKTLIITNTVEEVEHVFQAINNTSAFCLMVHEGLTYQFNFVIEQWRKPIGPGTHVILVMTNECLKALGIEDATCVVHYGFPSSPKLFGARLCCMAENFQNLSEEQDCEKTTMPARAAKSVLLLSERDTGHVIGVLRYLERSGAALPPQLLHFARGILRAKEEQKSGRPLCGYLKSFGFCRDSRVCPDRHLIDPELDAPQHPVSGNVVVLPLHIKNASCYHGRIVRRKEGSYESLAAEMAEHYAREKFNAKDVVEGGIYGILEEGVYHRVRVLVAPDHGGRLFCSVRVHFLDEGRDQEVKVHQLLALPAHLHALPPQAVEIVACRAKPIDGEVDWNPKVSRCIGQKIKGLEHHAKIVLSLGNTIWVDPMVRVTRLPGLKTPINEYNVRSEILATGMGTANPQHLELLRALCPDASINAEPGESSVRPAAPAEALEDQLRGPTEALEGQLRGPMEALEGQLRGPTEALEDQLRGPTEALEGQMRGPTEALEGHLRGPTEALDGHLSGPTEALEGHLRGPTEALEGQLRGPTEAQEGQLRGPTEALEGHLRGPTEALEGHLRGPTEALEGHLRGPTEALEGQLRGPTEALEGQLRGPTEALEGQLRGPTEALEGQLRGPTEALANGVEACVDDLQSGQGEPGDPPEREAGVPAPPPEGGPQAAPESAAGMEWCHSRMLFPGLGASMPNRPCAIPGTPENQPVAPATPLDNGVQENGINAGSSCGAPPVGCPAEEELPLTTWFHPHIKWFERGDSVMLNINLLNPTEQKCEFFSDRVVYSARLDDRRYRADLQLSASIMADASSWELRRAEPVLRLVKQRPGSWNALLNHRSPFVSFDFDHFEEDEPAVENMASEMGYLPVGDKGCCFVEQTGDEWCYERSDSESDSD